MQARRDRDFGNYQANCLQMDFKTCIKKAASSLQDITEERHMGSGVGVNAIPVETAKTNIIRGNREEDE